MTKPCLALIFQTTEEIVAVKDGNIRYKRCLSLISLDQKKV